MAVGEYVSVIGGILAMAITYGIGALVDTQL
jgi:hypothetical protein